MLGVLWCVSVQVYDGFNGLAVLQEGTFEFDEDFQNFSIGNPLLRKHKEWDEDAMTGSNGTPFLTPDRYNRCPPPPRQPAYALP